MRILALDLATVTGFANWDGYSIRSGSRSFKVGRGESPGMRFLKYEGWLQGVILRNRPEVIAYEQAHLRGGAASEVIVGLIVILKKKCAEHGIEYTDRHTATIKKHATGSGRASKEDMIHMAKVKFGKSVVDDNEADALHLLDLVSKDLGVDIWQNKKA